MRSVCFVFGDFVFVFSGLCSKGVWKTKVFVVVSRSCWWSGLSGFIVVRGFRCVLEIRCRL